MKPSHHATRLMEKPELLLELEWRHHLGMLQAYLGQFVESGVVFNPPNVTDYVQRAVDEIKRTYP